jgi:hypothetical protein
METQVVETGVLQDGVTVVEASSPRAVAKNAQFKDGKYRFYVKIGPEGSIYNPYGQNANGSAHLTSKRSGNYIWRYTEVNGACYLHYMDFLRNRNHRSLHYAERELRNG